MNILHVRPYIEFGGVAKYMIRLSSGLKDRGHKVFVASAGGELIQDIERFATCYNVIPLAPTNLKNFTYSVYQLRQIVQHEHIDLINTHHRFANIIGKIVARLSNIPFVSTVHEVKVDRGLVTRMGLGEQILTLSHAVKNHIVSQYNVKSEKVHVIPMGVEIPSPLSSYERDILVRKWGLDLSSPVIGCIGRLSAEKGQIYLIHAIPDILKIFPTTQFLFIGKGEEQTYLQNEVNRLGLSMNVLFLGWQDHIQSFIELCDFIVLPSITEGFGIVILEAFAQKKGVVATAVDNIPAIVRHNQTGILVPPCNSHVLAESIVGLLQNPTHLRKLGENGFDLVSLNYSINDFIVQTERVYLNLVKRWI